MRITFSIDGGFAYFPGLNKAVEIDTAALSKEEAAELEAAIREADFFNRPAQAAAPARGAADFRTYNITVTDGERSHSLRLSDPVADSRLQRLVDRLSAVARSAPK